MVFRVGLRYDLRLMSRKPPRPANPALVLSVVAALSCGCATSINDMLANLEYSDREGVREAIVEVGDFLSEKESAGYEFDEGDRAAIALLENELARTSPDSVLRACAISSLARLQSHDATETYLAAVDDDETAWIVRLEAARALRLHPESRAVEVLARRLQEERRLEVRLEVLKALEAAGGDRALRALLEAFLEPPRASRFRHLRLALYDAICSLSGLGYPLVDETSWRQFAAERFPPETAGEPPPDAPAEPPERGNGAPAPPRADSTENEAPEAGAEAREG